MILSSFDCAAINIFVVCRLRSSFIYRQKHFVLIYFYSINVKCELSSACHAMQRVDNLFAQLSVRFFFLLFHTTEFCMKRFTANLNDNNHLFSLSSAISTFITQFSKHQYHKIIIVFIVSIRWCQSIFKLTCFAFAFVFCF